MITHIGVDLHLSTFLSRSHTFRFRIDEKVGQFCANIVHRFGLLLSVRFPIGRRWGCSIERLELTRYARGELKKTRLDSAPIALHSRRRRRRRDSRRAPVRRRFVRQFPCLMREVKWVEEREQEMVDVAELQFFAKRHSVETSER